MIDLHMHTTYSDGTDTVKELLKKAEDLGLEVISITDHNTCKAYFEMENFNVKEIYQGDIIVGCEFTTIFDNRLIEILGYGFDYKKVNKYSEEFYNAEKISKNTSSLYNNYIKKEIEELNKQLAHADNNGLTEKFEILKRISGLRKLSTTPPARIEKVKG